jgi:uncharacterized membrane protein
MATQTALLIGCGVIALVCVPLILKKVPPNPLYGFRTSRTLADRALWFRVNCFAGWAFLLASAVGAILLVLFPASDLAVLQFIVPVAVALFTSLIYLWRTT